MQNLRGGALGPYTDLGGVGVCELRGGAPWGWIQTTEESASQWVPVSWGICVAGSAIVGNTTHRVQLLL
jgi:hypothetical protein